MSSTSTTKASEPTFRTSRRLSMYAFAGSSYLDHSSSMFVLSFTTLVYHPYGSLFWAVSQLVVGAVG